MKTVSIILNDLPDHLEGDIIGVDYGAYLCAQNEITMTIACGDFDSITATQKESVKQYAKQFLELNPIKDMTDFTYALSLCEDYDEIYVYGAIGRRIDHEMINLFQAAQDSRIILVDSINRIQSFNQGEYHFEKGMYRYFSIIPFEPACITLFGFKYPLERRCIKPYDDYLSSNEILDKATLIVHEGSILVIQANDHVLKSDH